MFFAEVTQLRRHGERLRKPDLAPPMSGLVLIVEMDRASNNFGRNVIAAQLWESYNTTSRRSLATIFDPVLLPNDERVRDRLPSGGQGMLIAGTELISSEGGRVIKEHRQIWLCRPIAPLY